MLFPYGKVVLTIDNFLRVISLSLQISQFSHFSQGLSHVGVDSHGIPLWPDVYLNEVRLDVFELYRGVVQHGGFSVVFPESEVDILTPSETQINIFRNMRNFHEGTIGLRGVLKAHYQVRTVFSQWSLNFPLAYPPLKSELC